MGMKPGETRTFDLTFPADWHVESLRGMRAEATIKAHELFSWVLPEARSRVRDGMPNRRRRVPGSSRSLCPRKKKWRPLAPTLPTLLGCPIPRSSYHPLPSRSLTTTS